MKGHTKKIFGFTFLFAITLATGCADDDPQEMGFPQKLSSPPKLEADVSAILEKYKTRSETGFKAELITVEDLQILEKSSNPEASKALQMLKTNIKEIESKIARAVGYRKSCEKSRAWKKLIQDPNQKIWLWGSEVDSVIPELADVRPKAEFGSLCNSSDTTRMIYLEHRENKSSVSPFFKKVVIQGAGPTGLLAALEFYQAGAKVIVIEKREKAYSRKQILRLDPKWRAILHFYLADDLFDSIAAGEVRINPEDESLEIPTFLLETMLKERLKLQERYQYSYEPDLQFTYGQVSYGNNGYVQYRFNEGFTDIQDVSLLLLSGGANNKLRDTLLKKPVTVTESRDYSVASFEKDSYYLKNAKCIKNPGFRSSLNAQQVKVAVKRVCDPYAYVSRFEGPRKICYNIAEQKPVNLRHFENDGLLYFGAEVPPVVSSLVKNCDDKTCIKRIADRWSNAVLEELSQCNRWSLREIDSSVSIFPVALSKTVPPLRIDKVYQGNSMAIIAAGDSLVTPHFFTGSGLTGARMAVEAINDRAREKNPVVFEEKISQRLSEITEFMIKKGEALYQ